MKTLIFLDDERNPVDVTWVMLPKHNKVIIVRTFKEFKEFVDDYITDDNATKEYCFSFDHDLADYEDGYEYTGFNCANYLLNHLLDNELNLKNIEYTAHSMNPIGRQRILDLLDCCKEDWDNFLTRFGE